MRLEARGPIAVDIGRTQSGHAMAKKPIGVAAPIQHDAGVYTALRAAFWPFGRRCRLSLTHAEDARAVFTIE